MPRHMVITSCDENFFPLAKGLILSIKAAQSAAHMGVIDIGLSPASRAWLGEQGVQVATFRAEEYYAIQVDAQYRLAQVCRPLLPALFPGYDVYTWIDSDIWLQERDVLDHHFQLAERFTDKAILSPCIDASYQNLFSIPDQIVSAQFRVYSVALGNSAEANTYAFRPILSSGLVSMAANCPLWAAWRESIGSFYSKTYTRSDDLHGLEQMALNHLVYSRNAFILLDATYNYHCHERLPFRDDTSGKVRVAMPPNRVIGAVHLSVAGHYMQTYLSRGLLFDGGKYLTADERAKLEAMGKHYDIGE